MNSPFFSIIIPTYNRAAHIGVAIKSVLEQTFTNYELIIVDDGSTDNTRSIVREFDDDRIKYHFKLNEERSIARNFGIDLAKGLYINFLDSDDYFYSHHLSCAYERLMIYNLPPSLHFGFEVRNLKGDLLETRKYNKGDINKTIILENTLLVNCGFVNRELFSEIRFLDSKVATISEDWFFWIKLAARYPIKFEDKVTCVVVEHKERSLNNLDPKVVEKSLQLIIKALAEDIKVTEFYGPDLKVFRARNYCFLALCFAIHNDKDKARTYLSMSRKTYPLIVLSKRYLAVLKKVALPFLG